MGILSGPEILNRIADGQIVIDPFDPARVGPNSVDLRLSDALRVYDLNAFSMSRGGWHVALDAKTKPDAVCLDIPAEGYVLQPGTLYLGSTIERTECCGLVPCLETRSSYARLGLSTHLSAGFGDDGFAGTWTLELTVVHPLRTYPGEPVCQVVFHELVGESKRYAGKYLGQSGPTPSRLVNA